MAERADLFDLTMPKGEALESHVPSPDAIDYHKG